MGSDVSAILFYGYDLGSTPWKIAEVNKLGDPLLPWYDAESGEDFLDCASEHLMTVPGPPHPPVLDDADVGPVFRRHGVEVESYCYREDNSYFVAAHVVTVGVEDIQTLDLVELEQMRAAGNWDATLRAALTALGITPTQKRPAWKLCAYE
ncbi:hypothetical protein [Planomonospora sp. ID82291]|uniref:hypothetical protein n=1 Tax=Planomonospora sp. ID82291 TaxID=2738136 RepID=UPI0018C42C5E|nr:hypothetical protein [Planomonospora sp. ID82291]MBG0818290.1 hypothetical protein [Planomonospora sp. ID82291]